MEINWNEGVNHEIINNINTKELQKNYTDVIYSIIDSVFKQADLQDSFWLKLHRRRNKDYLSIFKYCVKWLKTNRLEYKLKQEVINTLNEHRYKKNKIKI